MRTLAPALALLLAGCGDVADGAPEPPAGGTPATPCSATTATAATNVAIAAMQFAPFCATVPAGTEVTFTNLDAVEHTVTAGPGQPEQLESGLLRPGQRFSHRFRTAPRTVRVHSRLHPHVSGVVIVQ